MSSHGSKKINQKEYLKKYLSGDTNKKKKKVKKHKLKDSVKVKIIDDDASANTELDIDEELLLTGEDAPQIVGSYIEENPYGVVEPKWKSIVIKDEEDEDEPINVKPRIKLEEDVWGPKAIDRRIKDEFSPVRSKSPTSENLPARSRRDDENAIGECRRRSRSRSKERKKKRDNVTNGNSYNSLPRKKSNKRIPPRDMYQGNNHSEHFSTERVRRSLSSDQSPPRRRKRSSPRSSFRDQSPPRRKNRTSIDNSPPRKRNVDMQDQSPPRRRRRDSDDQSPPRRRKSDMSPQRRRLPSPVKIKREKESPNCSPARRHNRSPERESRMKYKSESSSSSIKIEPSAEKRSRWEPREPSRSLSPPPTHGKKTMTKTLDGKRAGLQDAEALKKENQEFRRREDDFFAKMSSEMSGRDAEVQVRSEGRRGRRARQAKELDPEEELRKEAHEKKKKELYDRWGKGLKQIEAHRSKVDEERYESSKPLARYSNDADLEQHLREQERPDDPMLDYMRKKQKDKRKDANVPTLPKYQGSFPENRFGLRPGYRWDGVDRSNGYEKKWFDKQNEKRAVQDEAYKYSVEDM